MSELWTRTLDALRPRVGLESFQDWFLPIEPRLIDEAHLELSVPNLFFKEWFENNYLSEVRATVAALDSQPVELSVSLRGRGELADAREAPKDEVRAREGSAAGPDREALLSLAETGRPEPDAQRRGVHAAGTGSSSETEGSAPSPGARDPSGGEPPAARRRRAQETRGLNPRYRFDNFILGAGNELAASGARAVADLPGRRFNPLFIYGGVGLGKTHLLQAVGNAISERDPDARVLYLSAESFMNDFVSAVRANAFDAFRKRYREEVDCLLIDDIQFIAGRDRTMDEFFHVFNALHEAGKPIVLSADRIPAQMEGMEDRITSRLSWGLVADVQAPDLETRMAIVEQRAEAEGLSIDRETARTIAELVDKNVRELEGALLRISAISELRGQTLSPEFVRLALGSGKRAGPELISVDAIQKVVATHYRLRVTDLKGRRRSRAIALPRMVAMYLARELSGASFPEIGMRFGGRDHSTVINACRRIATLTQEDEPMRATVALLRQTLSR